MFDSSVLLSAGKWFDIGAHHECPTRLSRIINRGYVAFPDNVLCGFAPVWYGDGTQAVLVGYDVDLDQCDDWFDLEVL